MNAADLGLDISTQRTFIPNSINRKLTKGMFNHCPEEVKRYARILLNERGWKFYVVNQTRGRCYGGWVKVITIPAWVYSKEPQKIIWYISHELAHAFDNCVHNHGPEFMEWLKRICPADCLHYELGYKPRNAKAAGISQNWDDLLGL